LNLATSLKQVMPKSIFIIALVEEEVPVELDLDKYKAVDQVILAKNFIETGSFNSWVFRYSVVEASTAIKGQLLSYLYQRFVESDQFIYLDPDTFVYSRFDELFDELQNTPIVVTPHLGEPGNLEMEISSLKHGVFNLGFLALARDVETEKFLAWWSDRLDFACYEDIPNGIFTDQKWINLAPGFFSVRVLRHPGYNFATWSLMDRKLSINKVGKYHVNDEPLRFTHFSGFDNGTFHVCVERWAKENSELLLQFAEEYRLGCINHQAELFKKIPWSYGTYESGKVVSRWARILWREIRRDDGRDPFKSSDLALSYVAFHPSRLRAALHKLLS